MICRTMPMHKIHATREMYVEKIINSQLDDGGWSLLGSGESDVDVTAMALQALSNYTDNSEVSNCVNKAISFLSAIQNENGGYSSWGTEKFRKLRTSHCCTL